VELNGSLTYTSVAAPSLTAAVPSQGPASGGSSVTLLGARLTTATSVLFGTTPASFTVLSDSTIVAVAPPVNGAVQVTVTAVGGTSNDVSYTGVAAPGI
jgi:hypothetical protein